MKYNSLFSPILINSMMLRNRIIVAPMGIMGKHKTISSTNYGAMSAWDRSMGGSALVHIPAEDIDVFSKYELATTKEQINVAKQDGAKVACEIGFFAMKPDVDGIFFAPSDGVRFDGKKVKSFTKEKMREVTDEMVHKCLNAKKIGFDAITLHFGHDALGSQFLSPVFNQRNDEYGGSLENRCRYQLEVLNEIRKAVGNTYPLILRISRQLVVKETYKEDDMLYFLNQAKQYIDMVNVSCGMDVYHEANVHAVPTIFEPHNYNKNFAKRVKEETGLKVCLVGAVMNPKEANELIEQGFADCCMFGRSTIADPYWPKKIMQNKEEDIVPCIRCMQCYHIASGHWNVQCSVNPRFRREDRMELSQPIETVKRNVVIVGGGVTGMVAALSAKKSGHTVTLIEKQDRLGGLLNWASKGPFKEDLKAYLNYLLTQISKEKIDVRLNTLATKEFVRSLNPDRLIIAVGSKERKLVIQGAEKMISDLDVIEDNQIVGQKVVIIGGGSIGCELALELSLLGKDVTIVEMQKDVALNGNMLYRTALLQHLRKQNNISIMLETKCNRIESDYVVVNKDNEELKIPYDTVVNSVGRISNSSGAFELYGICTDTVMIGDCEKVGSVVDATNIAYFVGKSL